jgi:hypothetical protein
MRRLVIGFVWFVVLYFGILGAGGAIVGTMKGSGGKNPAHGYQAGYAAGEEFGKQYGTVVLFVALGGAVLGTATGRLPGTRRNTARR